MYRVYVGNLDRAVTEESLRTVFADKGIFVSNILVKSGYGFVDCPDQSTFDQTIDQLNGYNLNGSVLQVEPSTVSKRRRSNKIQIRNLPQHITKSDVEQLVASFGTIQCCNRVSTSVENSVTVVYESSEQAQKAVDQLDNYDFEGSILRVEIANSRGTWMKDDMQSNRTGNSESNYLLRMLIPSCFIGAIIGKKGETIRQITADSGGVRIDVHGKEQIDFTEKIVSATGKPEAVTIACREILKVMQQQSLKNSLGEVMLKILAEDRFCGRVIGKEGMVIKKIREDTDTKIIVSNAQEVASLFPDRIITVRGSVDGLSKAEEAISRILRESFDKEAEQGMLHSSNSGTMQSSVFWSRMKPPGYMTVPSYPYLPKSRSAADVSTSLPAFYYITVPSSAVGVLIGKAGSNIKQIMRKSGAFVSIEPKKNSETNPHAERSVTIKGNSDSAWKASYFIFETMRLEGFAGNDDVRLRTFMKIPKLVAGRVIGKNGKNARDIEHMTGAIVRVTEDSRALEDEAMVEIFGNFMATQSAISRIRRIVNQVGQQTRPDSAKHQGQVAAVTAVSLA